MWGVNLFIFVINLRALEVVTLFPNLFTKRYDQTILLCFTIFYTISHIIVYKTLDYLILTFV